DELRHPRPRVSPGTVRAQSLRGPAHPARRRRPPERHDPLRARPEDLGARRELQGARARQPLRGRRELLSIERGCEPGADGHHQRAQGSGSSESAPRLTPMRRRPRWPTGLIPLTLGSLIWLAGSAQAAGLVQAVGPIGMTVADLDRSIAFYAEVLGFEKLS